MQGDYKIVYVTRRENLYRYSLRYSVPRLRLVRETSRSYSKVPFSLLVTQITNVCSNAYTTALLCALGFRTRWIDGIECDLFSIHAPLGQTTLCVG